MIDRFFYKKQVFDNVIRIIITLLKIRDLNIQKHESYEYVIYKIYIKNIKNNKSITSILRREIHLINNFKTNMLINNNVINVENIVVDSIKKKTFIINIDVAVLIKVKLSKTLIQRSIHIRKIIIVSFRSKITIFIHYVALSIIKNFLFESADNVNFTLYVYFVDISTFVVIIRNNRNQSIQISRNFRLEQITKLNFFNVF